MKKTFLLLTLFIYIQSFSQNTNYEVPKKDAFQPMFSLGSGYYNSLGNIKGPDGNYLLGNMGINTGIRINLKENLDLSFLFSSNAKLHEKSTTDQFDTDLNSVGFNLDYTFSNILSKTKISPFATLGAQWMNYRTTVNNNSLIQESGVSIPLGMGISLNVSERIRFDVGLNYHLSFADLDQKTTLQNNDNFTVVNFTLHYDLFTPRPDDYKNYDEKNYTNINFKAIDVEDNDGDGVSDIDDYCLATPSGVKVNEYGCPYDGDNDGIPNYLDKELNTRPLAIVNEMGIELTEEEYKSLYSEYDAATREYANFYNESEIRRDDYKNTNAFLIARANSFNKKYLESKEQKETGPIIKVQIGRFSNDIPSYLVNKILSYEDVESIPQGDGTFIYAVGNYTVIDDAENRQSNITMDDRGIETKIIIGQNGVFVEYKYPVFEEVNLVQNKEDSIDLLIELKNIEDNKNIKDTTKILLEDKNIELDKNKEKVIYRVQLGYFEKELSSNVFEGLNIISLKNEKGTFYLTGSYLEYEQALIKQAEMKVRGFSDAFIVQFKDGEKIKLPEALQTEKIIKIKEKIKEESKPEFEIYFVVQIGVYEKEVNSETNAKIINISGAEKILDNGDLYKYIAGKYKTISEAENRKNEVSQKGFLDAFIYATKNGERITVKEALMLLNR